MKLLRVSHARKGWRMRATYLLATCLAMSVACTPDYAQENRSPVLLIIEGVTAVAGGAGTGGALLLSDVLEPDGNGVFNDNVTLSLRNVPKNQQAGIVFASVTDILVESFQVRYIRSDGLDVEGVDVPFSITGAVTSLIPVNGTGSVSFEVVRHQAKREPPLANIGVRGATISGGARALTVFAKITLYGRTVAGQAVKSNEASLEIGFGDFS